MAGRRKSNLDEGGDDGGTWIWGNNRGGGGAPLKDTSGNTISNLKKVLNGTADVNYSSPSKEQTKRNYEQNGYEYNNNYDQRNSGNHHDPQDSNRQDRRNRRDNSDYDDNSRDNHRNNQDKYSSQNSPNQFGSPKKFLGALQEMNSGASQSERDGKIQ